MLDTIFLCLKHKFMNQINVNQDVSCITGKGSSKLLQWDIRDGWFVGIPLGKIGHDSCLLCMVISQLCVQCFPSEIHVCRVMCVRTHDEFGRLPWNIVYSHKSVFSFHFLWCLSFSPWDFLELKLSFYKVCINYPVHKIYLEQ